MRRFIKPAWIAMGWLLALRLAPAQALPPADAIIARVNGDPILLSQVREMALNQDIPLDWLTIEGLRGDAYRKVLTMLVDEKLLVQKARNDEMRAEELEIARLVEEMIKRLRERLGSEQDLDAFLEKNHLTLPSLRRTLIRRETNQALAAQVVARRVNVDNNDLAAFKSERRENNEAVEEVNLAHILLRCPPEERKTQLGEEIHLRALRIAQQIGAEPGRFTELVDSHSDDPASRRHGGRLGWMDPESLHPALRDHVAKMEPGDVSPPLQSKEGFHVLFLLGRHTPRDLLFAREFARERNDLLEQLRKQASIQLFDLNGKPLGELETP